MTENDGGLHRQPETARPTADQRSEMDIQGDVICASCPHPWSSHDRIAVRYCTATATATGGHSHSRGCVCTGK
nr:hypothetical protein [Kibdelosporangium sp. MJ126-NF4]